MLVFGWLVISYKFLQDYFASELNCVLMNTSSSLGFTVLDEKYQPNFLFEHRIRVKPRDQTPLLQLAIAAQKGMLNRNWWLNSRTFRHLAMIRHLRFLSSHCWDFISGEFFSFKIYAFSDVWLNTFPWFYTGQETLHHYKTKRKMDGGRTPKVSWSLEIVWPRLASNRR